MNKDKKSTLEELMGPEERAEMIAEDEADQILLDEPKKRTWLVVLLSVLAVLFLAAGGYVAWQSYSADKELKAEEKIENTVESPKTDTEVKADKFIYTNASDGLNMRKEAKSDAEVIAVIPFGTKLPILETSGDWYKVEYDSKTGWIAKLYTAEVDPLVYKDKTYGFQVTFPSTWAYKFYPTKSEEGVTAGYYVSVPTTDATIDESSMGVDKGYASLFAISVYTPSQWEAAKAAGGPVPTVAAQSASYVVTYSMPNGVPASDLAARIAEVKSVIATIKF